LTCRASGTNIRAYPCRPWSPLQHEPHLGAFYQRLVSRGKARLQAVIAVMRKLPAVVIAVVLIMTVIHAAVRPHLLKLTSALLRLAAVFAVFSDRLLQVSFSFLSPLLALVIAVTGLQRCYTYKQQSTQ
jgi:hypothetical protein